MPWISPAIHPKRAINEWISGGVLVGKASDCMAELSSTLGYQWSIQKGKHLLLAKDATTDDETVVLNEDSGMIGAPEVGEDGEVTVKSLMNGKLSPGRRVELESDHAPGVYRVDRSVWTGDTQGTDWTVSVELYG